MDIWSLGFIMREYFETARDSYRNHPALGSRGVDPDPCGSREVLSGL